MSGRDPDGSPTCLLQWGGSEWTASVHDVRQTALDLVTCAAYAEVMMHLMRKLDLPAPVLSQMFTEILSSSTDRPMFGTPATFAMSPAGSSTTRQGCVAFVRGRLQGTVTPATAREMAMQWLGAAEASESDQLVVEALRTAGHATPEQIDGLFRYLQALRSRTPDLTAPGATEGDEVVPTAERLARALDAAMLPEMAARAREGYYDEWRSELPFPLMQLVNDLNAAGRVDLVERVKAGEFDATAEEAQAWAASPEGQETMQALWSSVRKAPEKD